MSEGFTLQWILVGLLFGLIIPAWFYLTATDKIPFFEGGVVLFVGIGIFIAVLCVVDYNQQEL